MAFMATGYLGLGDWKKIVQDTRDARKQMEIDKQHEKEEKSEELSEGNLFIFILVTVKFCLYLIDFFIESMKEIEKGMKKAQVEATKERKDRAYGLKHVKNVPLPGVKVAKMFFK